MIRRSLGNDRWALISQVEHARLSGALAAAWGREAFAPLDPREQIVAAITHHDDGWSAWEVSPKVDAQTGCPLDFTEMPLTDSLAIWRESIRRAASIGPLAVYMVSGHFSARLERFSSRWTGNAPLERLAHDFLSEQSGERQLALTQWAKGSAGDADVAAHRAVGWLQTFDALSLWLCVAERRESEHFHPPDGLDLLLRPAEGAYTIEVSPWPFREPALELEVIGRSIAARRYANSSDLITAPAEPVTLRWSFRPVSL
jgi:hypothetical protein